MAKITKTPDCLTITLDWLEFTKLVGGTVTASLRPRLPGYKAEFDNCKVARIAQEGYKVIILMYNNYDIIR